jgi:hypothetical protein
VQAVLLLKTPLVCAGTKLRLPDLTIVQSGASKIGAAETGPEAVAVTVFPFFEAQTALVLLRQIVSVPDDWIAGGTQLEGRARLWASFVDVVLHRARTLAGDPLEQVVRQCHNDFIGFHVHGKVSASPLTIARRSIRGHFDKHLARASSPTSPDRMVTLDKELAELVVAGLLGLGEPRSLLETEADWVSGGICFLHEVRGEAVLLSCKEPLVLNAIVARVGVHVIIDSVSATLRSVQSLLTSQDSSKGILLQHLTVAQLLQEARENHVTIGSLLEKWKVPKAKFPRWLKDVADTPLKFEYVDKDPDGFAVDALLKSHGTDRLLVLPNSARAEYLGLAGSLVITAGCKFYSKTDNDAFSDNELTTDIDQLFRTKKGVVNEQYKAQQKAIAQTLAEKIQSGAIQGTVRLVFSISKTYKSDLFKVEKKDRAGRSCSDVIVTFTRSNLSDFFDASTAKLIGSFYP